MRVTNLVYLSAIIGLILIMQSGCVEEKTPWDIHMEKGEQFLQEQKFTQAEAELKAALSEVETPGRKRSTSSQVPHHAGHPLRYSGGL